MSPRLLAVWLAAVGCAVWLWAGGCAPAAVTGWPLPCALWAFACWLWPVVGCQTGPLAGGSAPVLCRCWWRLSGCVLSGGYRGRIYQAPRRLYRARKTLPARLGRLPRRPVFAASLARRRRRSAARRHWPPVLPSAGSPVGGPPGAFLPLASCLPVCRSCPPPRTAPRKPPEKTRRIFPPLLPDGSRRAGSERHGGDYAGGRRKFPVIFPARYFTRPV